MFCSTLCIQRAGPNAPALSEGAYAERLNTRRIGTDQVAAPIMETSQEFRTFSKQCDRLAEEAETKNERHILKELAVAWEKVAEEYERKQLLDRQ